MTLFSRASFAVIAATLPFIAACTGGQITDAHGNVLTGGYTVLFSGPWDTGLAPDLVPQFSTGVNADGVFSFDPDAPGSASNDSVMLPQGTYWIYVFTPGGGQYYQSPSVVQLTYDNVKCQDFYVPGDTEPCALFQLQLQVGAGSEGPYTAPTTAGDGSYKYTIVPLYPLEDF